MLKVFSDERPSEEMERAVASEGSSVVDCQFCGRTHYDYSSPGHFESGELERLSKKNEEDSDKVCAHHGSIQYGYIKGKQAVIGCHCNILRVYEDLFWDHRFMISDYLVTRAALELKQSQDSKRVADKASAAVNKK